MASEAVGGLYVAVGINAKPAIEQATALQSAMLNVSKAITAAGRNQSLDELIKKMERLAAATERVNGAFPKSVPKLPPSEPVGQPAIPTQKSLEKLSVLEGSLLTQRLNQNEDFVRRVLLLEQNKNVSLEQMNRLRLAREQALELQAAARTKAISQSVYEKRMSDLNKEVSSVQQAVNREISARKQLQQAGSLGGALGSGTQELLVGLGAARSGNYFYGLAALARGFKNVSSELRGARDGVDGLGAAAQRTSGIFKTLGSAAAIGLGAVAVAAVAAATAVVAVGVKIAEAGLKQASNLEMLKIQYEGLLGSAIAAQAEVNRVLELGTRSIVPTEQLLDANRLLLSFGVNATAQRRDLLEFISAFSSVTGASLTQVQNLSYALGQIVAAGKANSIDLRQLANAGVSTSYIFEQIAKQQGISVSEARNLNEQGKLTADIIIPAILAKTKDLEAAQEKARQSAYGIYVNLKDIARIKLGQAFQELLQTLKPLLKFAEEFIKSFDFGYIARSFENVVGYFKKAFGGIKVNAKDTAKTVAETIGNVINVVGFVAVKAVQQLQATFQTVVAVVELVRSVILFALAGVQDKIAFIAGAAGKIASPWQKDLKAIEQSSKAAAKATRSDAVAAGNAWSAEADKAKKSWFSFFTDFSGFKPVAPDNPYEKYIPNTSTFKIKETPYDPPLDLNGSGNKKDPALERAKQFIEMAKKLIGDAKNAGEKLGEALTIPFAEAVKRGGAEVKTASEEAFSSMDINTIVEKFKELNTAIEQYYKPLESKKLTGSAALSRAAKIEREQLQKELESQTAELVYLASSNKKLAQDLEKAQSELDRVTERLRVRREELTAQYNRQKKTISQQFDDYYVASSATEGRLVEGALTRANRALDAASRAYEAARDKLEQLKEARDSFLEGVKNSLVSFVNNISGVAKEIEKYTRLDEMGSFTLTKSSETDLAAFKKSLQDRLDALRTWREQIQQLMARGLDSNFLQSLVQQGPEASKEIVAALAGASNQELADINGVQMQLSNEITALQQASSQKWFDAGIAAQEAFTAPLRAAYEQAQAEVTRLEEQKALALGILEAWYADQNALIDQEQAKAQADFDRIRADLEAKQLENKVKADQIAKDINKIWGKLPGQAYRTGVETMEGLLEGIKSKEEALKNEARRIAAAIRDTLRSALDINSPSRVMATIGEDVVDGLIMGMESAGAALSDTNISLGGFVPSARMMPGEQQITVEPPVVRVYIGDKELRDIVDVQIDDASRADRDLAIAGRRF